MHRSGWGAGLLGAVLILQAPAPRAQEGCPVGADLAQGIRVTYANGKVELFRTGDAPELVVVSGVDDGTSGFRRELVHGVVEVASTLWVLADGEPERPDWTFDYGRSASEVPRPAPETSFGSDVTVATNVEEVAGASYVQARSVTFGPLGSVEIGGCRYDAIPTEVVIGNPMGPAFRLGSTYLPELGVNVQDWWYLGDSSRQEMDAVSIEAKRR